MATQSAGGERPLWLLIEDEILRLGADDFSPGNLEQTIQRIAGCLDGAGINVSKNAGHMLQLRAAVDERIKVGRPLLEDLNGAVADLKLEDVADTYVAAVKITNSVGEVWSKLKESQRKSDIHRIVKETKFELVVARAKELGGEPGIRFLLEEKLAFGVIIDALGVSQEEVTHVDEAVKAERAERERVTALLAEAADKTDEEKVKNLVNHDVADDLILELAGVEQGMLDDVKKMMEAELEEKRRLAEEEAAKKKAEAEGPPLEDIPPDQMLEYIESIREILEFSDAENEIRTMCDQSSIPKSLVDVAVSDAGRLDALESQAQAG